MRDDYHVMITSGILLQCRPQIFIVLSYVESRRHSATAVNTSTPTLFRRADLREAGDKYVHTTTATGISGTLPIISGSARSNRDNASQVKPRMGLRRNARDNRYRRTDSMTENVRYGRTEIINQYRRADSLDSGSLRLQR